MLDKIKAFFVKKGAIVEADAVRELQQFKMPADPQKIAYRNALETIRDAARNGSSHPIVLRDIEQTADKALNA